MTAERTSPQFGPNHTGVAIHEDEADAMQRAAHRFQPSSTGTSFAAEAERIRYECDNPCSLGLGSVPAPNEQPKTAVTNGAELAADKLALLLDKLGDRLAFERTGVRLYEGLLAKFDAFGEFSGGPARREIIGMLEDEHRHFKLLIEIIDDLGGDPTAVTPAADVQAVASMGIVKVLSDPRTTLTQALDAMLTAELTDHEAWTMLSALGREFLAEDVVERFERAEDTEREHLERVRRWLRAASGLPAEPREGKRRERAA